MLPPLKPKTIQKNRSIIFGNWGRFKIIDFKKKLLFYKTINFLEKTNSNWWIEFGFEDGKLQPILTIKTLIEGDYPDNFKLKKAIVKLGKLAPKEIPLNKVVDLKRLIEIVPQRGTKKKVASNEYIIINNTKIKTTHYKLYTSQEIVDIWYYEKLPLWKIVKYQSKDLIMELVEYK